MDAIYPYRTTTPIGSTITPEDNYHHVRNMLGNNRPNAL